MRYLVSSRLARLFGVLIALWSFLSLHPDTREAFLTTGNFSNLTAQISEIVIIGVGVTLVVLIRGIDLSVGAGMALFGVIAAKLQIDSGKDAATAIVVALSFGALVGVWHGILVSRFAIPPFVATLSGFLAYRGMALVLSDARGLSPMADDFAWIGGRIPPEAAMVTCFLVGAICSGTSMVTWRRRAKLGLPKLPTAQLAVQFVSIAAVTTFALWVYHEGMPVPVLIAGTATWIGVVLLRHTLLGRYAFAIGGNPEAARLAGVPVARITTAIYLFTGILTAVAGLVAAARTNGVTPGNAGIMRELHVVTAVVIGGTSLSGGRADMLGTVLGALIFGTLSNGMNLMNVNSNWQQILTGLILLGASMLDSTSSKKDIS